MGFSYEAECSSLKIVTLTLNFEGSVNFAIDDFGSSDSTAGFISRHIVNFSRV